MSLPIIRGSSQALYPFTRRATYLTRCQINENASEQRWKTRGCLMEFDLPYSKIKQADKDTLKAAVASAKGRLTTNLSLALGTTTYSNLTLMDDNFTGTEGATLQYSAALKLRQVIPQTVTPFVPSGTPVYPSLASGATTQRPFSQIQRYQTIANEQETGQRYAFGEFGTGQTNFPTRGLFSWQLSYPVLQDADLDTIEAFFHWAWGMWSGGTGFSFTDPESGTTYTKVRFDMDTLEVNYTDINQTSLVVKLAEFN